VNNKAKQEFGEVIETTTVMATDIRKAFGRIVVDCQHFGSMTTE
jgi:hypothetical protein